jgi:hypothetical protein
MKRIFFVLLAIALFALSLAAQDGAPLEHVLNNGFVYRNLGPFRVSAWVSDIAVPETPTKAHLYTFYVASRNGGVWKTTNNGTTFTTVFEGKDVASIGALAIAPSNSDIVSKGQWPRVDSCCPFSQHELWRRRSSLVRISSR